MCDLRSGLIKGLELESVSQDQLQTSPPPGHQLQLKVEGEHRCIPLIEAHRTWLPQPQHFILSFPGFAGGGALQEKVCSPHLLRPRWAAAHCLWWAAPRPPSLTASGVLEQVLLFHRSLFSFAYWPRASIRQSSATAVLLPFFKYHRAAQTMWLYLIQPSLIFL